MWFKGGKYCSDVNQPWVTMLCFGLFGRDFIRSLTKNWENFGFFCFLSVNLNNLTILLENLVGFL
jgi:hypothetical protein